MKRYVDLSGKLENGLWAYDVLPGLEKIIRPISIETIATIREDGCFASRITLSTVSGTYVEAGAHILKDGNRLEDYSVEDFIKPVSLIRLPNQKGKALVDEKILADHAPEISKGEALVVDTGWGRMWNKPGYVLQSPNFSRRAIEWILEQEISIFGTDVTCIESSWVEDEAENKGGLLGAIFKKNVILVAPLINLDQISEDKGILFCLPLNVAGTSGAPARIVFEQEINS